MPRKRTHLFPIKTHSIYFVLYSYTAKWPTGISMFADISSMPAAACVELQDEKGVYITCTGYVALHNISKWDTGPPSWIVYCPWVQIHLHQFSEANACQSQYHTFQYTAMGPHPHIKLTIPLVQLQNFAMYLPLGHVLAITTTTLPSIIPLPLLRERRDII